ncbi:L-serine dehydratase, beta chain [compost metagenome]
MFGSFADTYRGHGTDLAIVGGLLDYETDHEQIPHALEDAASAGLEIIFQTSKTPAAHPNTATLTLTIGDKEMSMTGASIGGGNIEIVNVDQFDIKFTGEYPTLVVSHHDHPGIIADITAILSREQMNIGYMDLDRKQRDGEAMTVIEVDSVITNELMEEISQLKFIDQVRKVDLTGRGSS